MNMIRCMVLVSFNLGGKDLLEGRICNLPPNSYRKLRGLDFVARICKMAALNGREFLTFCDQPGVTLQGTVVDERLYYFLGGTCIHSLEPISPEQEVEYSIRDIQDNHATLPLEDKAEMFLQAQIKVETRDRKMSDEDRLAWIDVQLQSGRRLCCGGVSRLRAWRKRVEKSLAARAEAG